MENKNILLVIVTLAIAIGLVSLYYSPSLTGQVIVTKTCIDTDSGINYFTKGQVLYGEIVIEDECIRNIEWGIIAEKYCKRKTNGAYIPASSNYICKYGCEEGACKLKD